MNIFNILLFIMLLFNVNSMKPRVYIRIPQYYTNVYVNNFINERLLTNCYGFVETEDMLLLKCWRNNRLTNAKIIIEPDRRQLESRTYFDTNIAFAGFAM